MSDVQTDQTSAYLRRIDARLDRLDARIEALTREGHGLNGRRARRDSLDRLFVTIRVLLIGAAVLVVGELVLRLAAVTAAAAWMIPYLSRLSR